MIDFVLKVVCMVVFNAKSSPEGESSIRTCKSQDYIMPPHDGRLAWSDSITNAGVGSHIRKHASSSVSSPREETLLE